MTSEILVGVAAAPLIAALVQVFKPFLKDDRLFPLAALALGVGYNVLIKAGEVGDQGGLSWAAAVILGVTTGLAASGMYSGAKTISAPLVGDGGGGR